MLKRPTMLNFMPELAKAIDHAMEKNGTTTRIAAIEDWLWDHPDIQKSAEELGIERNSRTAMRKRERTSDWKARLERFSNRNGSVAKFCLEEDTTPQTLYKWRKILNGDSENPDNS